MPLDDWMPTLRTNIKNVSAIKKAYKYDEIPHKLGVMLPAAIILPQEGEQEYSEGGPSIALHQVQIAVYTSPQIVPQAMGRAVPLIEAIRNALANDIQLGGNVEYCLPFTPFYQGPGVLEYDDTPYVGLIFNVLVKENETGTFTVQR